MATNSSSIDLFNLLFGNGYVLVTFKIGILIILFLYAIFALIIVRQVNLMTQTLHTRVSPIVSAFALLHAGFAVGFIFLITGMFVNY